MFLTARFSTTMTWLSFTSLRDNLCWKSLRVLALGSWTRATLRLAFPRRFDPFSLPESECCLRLRFFSRSLRGLGLSNLEPSAMIAKWVSPTSIPTALPCELISNSGSPSSNKRELILPCLAHAESDCFQVSFKRPMQFCLDLPNLGNLQYILIY